MNSVQREHDRKVFRSLGPLSSCEEKMVRMVMAHYEARLVYQAVMLSRGESLRAMQEQAAWNYLRYRKIINSEALKPVNEIRFPKGYRIGQKRPTLVQKIKVLASAIKTHLAYDRHLIFPASRGAE